MTGDSRTGTSPAAPDRYRTREYNREQYRNSANLASRIRIYEFNTNPQNWYRWLFRQLPSLSGKRVLELACGNGNLWAANRDLVPADARITLSDLSPGMLDDCRRKLAVVGNFDFRVLDIAATGLPARGYDLVVANHVLYHLPDLDAGLAEIRRILADDGTFAASTIGEGDNRELAALARDYEPRIPFRPELIPSSFGLENGTAALSRHFGSVELRIYENSLAVTDPEAIVGYLSAVTGFDEIVTDLEDFRAYVRGRVRDAGGCFRITKATGVFLALK